MVYDDTIMNTLQNGLGTMAKREAGKARLKNMSHALRHVPEGYGISLNADGTVLVSELADALNSTVQDVLHRVRDDNKGRYQLIDRDGDLYVRALHGHTIPVEVEMERIARPGLMFHGTKVYNVDSIMQQGILRGARNYVHLSTIVANAVDVADRRAGDTVILLVDGDALVEAGHEVFLTATGIYLTKHVPVDFITELVYR